MPTVHERATWTPVSGVQPAVYVARVDGHPVAIIELRLAVGFRLTTCAGEVVGDFHALEEGEAALEAWLRARAG